MPANSVEVVQVATPEVGDTGADEHTAAVPSKNVTVPDGCTDPDGAITVAVKVTD